MSNARNFDLVTHIPRFKLFPPFIYIICPSRVQRRGSLSILYVSFPLSHPGCCQKARRELFHPSADPHSHDRLELTSL